MGYGNDKKENNTQLNEALASFDSEGNLVISLHDSGVEFFEPFIMENKLLNKEKDFLSISEEAASGSQKYMMRWSSFFPKRAPNG